jgi:hypothetical protein
MKIISSTLVEKYSAMAYAGDLGVLGKFILGKNSLSIGVSSPEHRDKAEV